MWGVVANLTDEDSVPSGACSARGLSVWSDRDFVISRRGFNPVRGVRTVLVTITTRGTCLSNGCHCRPPGPPPFASVRSSNSAAVPPFLVDARNTTQFPISHGTPTVWPLQTILKILAHGKSQTAGNPLETFLDPPSFGTVRRQMNPSMNRSVLPLTREIATASP
jgi:hypothetical protein